MKKNYLFCLCLLGILADTQIHSMRPHYPASPEGYNPSPNFKQELALLIHQENLINQKIEMLTNTVWKYADITQELNTLAIKIEEAPEELKLTSKIILVLVEKILKLPDSSGEKDARKKDLSAKSTALRSYLNCSQIFNITPKEIIIKLQDIIELAKQILKDLNSETSE